MDSQTTTSGDAAVNRVDPVTARIVYGALDTIAVEMGQKLMRMSNSSIIRESEDFGAAICDERARQLCECRLSTPLQSGPIPGYVAGIMRTLMARRDHPHPGDVILHNDPYAGASHSPDIGVCVPVFYRDELVGFSMTTAHHLDIGSGKPGSVGVVDCVDVFAEGLQLKAIKAYARGERNDMVWQMLRDNIRVPDLTIGDLEAQVAVARIGAQRYCELLERFGSETVRDAADDLFDYSERLMRGRIEAIPDGSYSATGHLDGYLDDAAEERKQIPIVVTVTVEGSDMTVDFTGSSPQIDDRPINMPFVGTVDVSVWLTLRSILLDTNEFGDIPQNAGLYRPITITAPRGCIANPVFPAPSIARFAPGNVVADTLMRALAPAVPHDVSAGTANLKAIAFTGVDAEQPWVHIEIFEGSYGGRDGLDGMDAVDTLYANTRNNPIEDIESHNPLQVTRYELRENACAPGKWRGGVSTIKSVKFLADGAAGVEGDGHSHGAWGFQGGNDGAPSSLHVISADGQHTELPSMMPARVMRAGAELTAVGGSGGGYGPPLER
ncbi:MAG: hydantoinase B/oxoprolinase family protein, partial [Gammaproteobacteria bacterium]|nr:hydantoinase B/oxoprolinase family protein [Gammaproteobacteria bacterium]